MLSWWMVAAILGVEMQLALSEASLDDWARAIARPTIAPGGSASLEVAYAAPHDAELAVRVFDTATPDHYVEFSD